MKELNGKCNAGSERILKQHGKSFYFAGKFLGTEVLRNCARLYAFCRTVDDLVDLASSPERARLELQRIRTDLKSSQKTADLRGFIDLSREFNLHPEVTQQLLDGMELDLEPVRIRDVSSLIKYCYQAAGTVGIHMATLLGAHDKVAVYHAIDLGIAMQLTNIARDVIEDARRDRIYLPQTWVGDLSPSEIVHPDEATESIIRSGVTSMLSLAETYYESGISGICYLPPRSRIGIYIAARLYAQIGAVLKGRGYDIWRGRACVGYAQKVMLMGPIIAQYFCRGVGRKSAKGHQKVLHHGLLGSPFCHE